MDEILTFVQIIPKKSGMKSWYQLRYYWRYLFQTRHRHGHGVHSPFVFDLITEVIEERYPYACYWDIEASLGDETVPDSLSKKAARLLFRLLYYWRPDFMQAYGMDFAMTEGAGLVTTRAERGAAYAAFALRAAVQPDFPFLSHCRQRNLFILNLQAMDQTKQDQVLAHIQDYVRQHNDTQKPEATMLIILRPHACKRHRQCVRQLKAQALFPLVLDMYDMTVMVAAPQLAAFESKISY